MKIARPTARRARIEMLPLIDIVFLLLVFFIYTMLSMAVHHSLPVALPTSAVANLDRDRLLTVTVQGDGSLFLDQQPVTLADLEDILRAESSAARDKGVQLFADRDLRYQTLFAVLDAVKRAGIEKITLQAEGGR
jgi:biopolymer transport protein ExbD